MIVKINDNPTFIDDLFILNEAPSYVNGYVNKLNCRYSASVNNLDLRERPLHKPKVTVWCALSTYGLVRLGERDNATTVTSVQYVAMFETFVADQLENFSDLVDS